MDSERSVASSGQQPPSEDDYERFLASVRDRFHALTQAQTKPPPLFMTAAGDLFERLLDAVPAELRQEHNCACCRDFLARFGGLVTIDEHGRTQPALWAASPEQGIYKGVAQALADAVAMAPVVGVFLTSEASWGTASKGGWTHLAVTPTAAQLFATTGTRSAAQAAAERREDLRTLVAGLEQFPLPLVENAASLLETGALYRSEKCVSVANWLLGVHRARKSAKSARARTNLTWRAVATAPPGFCHVRSSMIGTLLEDLAAELPFAQIKLRFDAKLDPLQYQRPTAPPTQQNIERAEAIIAKLRSAGALERRFAKLADIEALWRAPTGRSRGGVFGHLEARAKTRAALDAPPTVITWEKFAKTVIPDAAAIHYCVPKTAQSYLGLVTAKHPEAPPIVQWDSAERRNPVTWYVYVSGSLPERWNLRAKTDHPVTAITLAPSMWGGAEHHSHQGKKVIFLLEGARDLDYASGAGLFPEFLKADYREIRAPLEAYLKAAVVEGKDEADACGVLLQAGATWGHTFRVTRKNGVVLRYQLDRWD